MPLLATTTLDRYQYLLLMAGCLVLTLPLEFVLGARVWRSPGRTLRALVPGLVVFYAWDMLAVARDHWTFDPRYTTGWTLPGGVPVEELTFFVVIPICALLTYEAVRLILARGRLLPDRAANPSSRTP